MISYRFTDMHQSSSERQALFDDIVDKGSLEGPDLKAFITEIENLIGSYVTPMRISAAKREIERELERFCDALPGATFDKIEAEGGYERLTKTITDEFDELLK